MEENNDFYAYGSFAAVYDTFMDNVPYEDWGMYLQELLIEHGIDAGLVLDLGCGTGTMTELLAYKGYDMIGVDNSPEMLAIALEKKEKSGHDILYLLQDMREFELYGSVRAIVCICDSLNYITDPKELIQVFRLANTYLDIGGVFIFDFNTEYKYREIIGDCTIAESRDDCSFIWENYYDEEEQINEYELNLFIKEKGDSSSQGDVYRKYQETHFQRGYTLEEIMEIVQVSGLQIHAVYDAFTRQPPDQHSERIYMVTGKGEK